MRARGLESPRLSTISLPHLHDTRADVHSDDSRFDAERVTFDAEPHLRFDRSTLSECALPGLRAQSVRAEGARFAEVVADDLDVLTWRGQDSSWREVEFGGGRIGSLDLSVSDLSSVRFTGLRVGFADLRGATLGDVVFERCSFGTLDLPSAVLKRVRFESCTVDELDLRMAACTSADLRGLDIRGRLEIAGRASSAPLDGVWITADQARDLAPVLARTAGLSLTDD